MKHSIMGQSRRDWYYPALILLGMALGASVFVILFEAMQIATEQDYSRIPTLSYQQLSAESLAIHTIVKAPPDADPHDYYQVAVRALRLDAELAKYRNRHDIESQIRDPRIADNFLYLTNSVGDLNILQQRYADQYGMRRMEQVADEMQPWIQRERAAFAEPSLPFALQRFLRLAIPTWIASIMLAVAFLVIRIKDEGGLLLWPEVATGRLIACAITWPVAVWRYPSHIDPIKQVQRAYQFIAALVGGMITFGAMTCAANASERQGSEDTTEPGNVLVITDVPKPPQFNFSFTTVSEKANANGTVLHQGPVAVLDANVTFNSGWTVDYWGSRAYAGSKASDENDLTVLKSWKVDSWSPTVGLAYYDIQPLGTAKGGDMVSPILQLERPVGHGLTAFAKGETYFFTSGDPKHGGGDVTFGLKGAHPFGPVTLSQSAAVLYAHGPFGQPTDTSFRYDASASVPLARHLSGFLSLKAFAPLTGKRHPAATVFGFGLAAAY